MYLPDIQVIMFDADDTLRRCTVPEQSCPYREGEWEIIPGVREHIGTLRKEYPYLRFAIVSNQGGVASGKVEEALAMQMLEELATQLFGTHEAKVWICPHSSKGSCLCRKPSPLLLMEAARYAARDFPTPLQRDRVLYVGDMVSDMHAAASAGFLFLWEYEFFPGRARRDFR